MKNRIISLTVAAALTLGLLTGCGQSSDSVTEDTKQTEDTKELEKIKVGACVTPHAEILNEVKEDSAKTKALVEAVLSDKVRDYINDNYKGAVIPVF